MGVMTVTDQRDQAPITRDPAPGRRERGADWRRRWVLVAAPLVLAIAVAVGGCEPSPAADRQLHLRTVRLQHTVNVWAKSEQGRPARLQRSVDYIPFALQRNATRLKAAGDWFVDWQRRDIKRFQDRGPVYLDKTGHVLWGKPEEIEQRVIMFF